MKYGYQKQYFWLIVSKEAVPGDAILCRSWLFRGICLNGRWPNILIFLLHIWNMGLNLRIPEAQCNEGSNKRCFRHTKHYKSHVPKGAMTHSNEGERTPNLNTNSWWDYDPSRTNWRILFCKRVYLVSMVHQLYTNEEITSFGTYVPGTSLMLRSEMARKRIRAIRIRHSRGK